MDTEVQKTNRRLLLIIEHYFVGILNEFLSSKMFLPISRLSYPIYLINFTLNTAYVSYLRVPYNVNLLNLIIAALGMLILALILSVFLSIFIEMPFRNLEKIVLFDPTYPPALTKNQKEEVSLSSNAR